MIASTQITNIEIFAFIAVLVFRLLSHKVLFINRKVPMVAEGCHSEKKNNNNKKSSMFQKNFVYKKIINKVNLLRL